ncbi:MAG: hypothetical protein B7Z26_07435 [Asticcacaulis sp. 32-58-5]|nr:MAG: hypothetical protein B7Z26_07435 [Asticcacaulis sp. 32-58-5]
MTASTLLTLSSNTLVTLSGNGEITTRADRAVISFSVTAEGDSAPVALQAHRERISAVMAALKAAGVSERDIQAPSQRVNENFDPKGTKPRFAASGDLSVTLTDTAKLNAVTDAVLAAGASRISNTRYSLSDDRASRRQARQLALDDARAEAEHYAKTLNLKVKRIVRISETTASPTSANGAPVVIVEANSPSASSDPTVKTRVTVRTEFELVKP